MPLGDRLTAGQQSLELLIGVRIPVPQPIYFIFLLTFLSHSCLLMAYFLGVRELFQLAPPSACISSVSGNVPMFPLAVSILRRCPQEISA